MLILSGNVYLSEGPRSCARALRSLDSLGLPRPSSQTHWHVTSSLQPPNAMSLPGSPTSTLPSFSPPNLSHLLLIHSKHLSSTYLFWHCVRGYDDIGKRNAENGNLE